MTDKLKNELLRNNIQCVDEENGKFVFLMGKQFITESSSPSLFLPVLFNKEIAVGSYLMVKVVKSSSVKIATFICLNASQDAAPPTNFAMNNVFWFEITSVGFNFIRAV